MVVVVVALIMPPAGCAAPQIFRLVNVTRRSHSLPLSHSFNLSLSLSLSLDKDAGKVAAKREKAVLYSNFISRAESLGSLLQVAVRLSR